MIRIFITDSLLVISCHGSAVGRDGAIFYRAFREAFFSIGQTPRGSERIGSVPAQTRKAAQFLATPARKTPGLGKNGALGDSYSVQPAR